MTRFQILLYLDRYAKRVAFENGVGDAEEEAQMTTINEDGSGFFKIDENSTIGDWEHLYPAKNGTVTMPEGVYGSG